LASASFIPSFSALTAVCQLGPQGAIYVIEERGAQLVPDKDAQPQAKVRARAEGIQRMTVIGQAEQRHRRTSLIVPWAQR